MENVNGRFINQLLESLADQIVLSDSKEIKKYEKKMKKKYKKTKKEMLRSS